MVENQAHLAPALSQLRSSMQDSVIAIDLEWRPQFGKGFTPVALMQLASSRCVGGVLAGKLNCAAGGILAAHATVVSQPPAINLCLFSLKLLLWFAEKNVETASKHCTVQMLFWSTRNSTCMGYISAQ